MRLLIDCSKTDEIRNLYEFYPVSGVTTNPSILAKCGRNPAEVLREIRSFIGKDSDLHVQVIGKTSFSIVKDGHAIARALGDNTFIKVPCIEEGFKAMKILVKDSLRVTGTAVYTPMQAYFACECGASWVAPYVNRIDNMGLDGVQTAIDIQNIIENNGYSTQLIGASFKNTRQILELCKYGVAAVTASPDVIRALTANSAVELAVNKFNSDFESIAGIGKTMSDIL